MPETSWSFHYWQPAPRWRLHRWLAKPDNPAMSPHAPRRTGTRHTDTQWKAEGGEGGREQKPLNAPHTTLLLPTTLINKRYSPKHEVFHTCASILNPLTNWLQSLLVVYLVSFNLIKHIAVMLTSLYLHTCKKSIRSTPASLLFKGLSTEL